VAGCTSVSVARPEAVHLVSSAIVKRCEPVNITRLRCSALSIAAEYQEEEALEQDRRSSRK
jgi:hypothetical protein